MGAKAFAAEGRAVSEVRRFVAEAMPEGERAETAVLLVSERFTNSVRHSASQYGGEVTVRVYDADGALRVEVVDEGAPTEPMRRSGDEPREHGYGVLLIEELADRSGHYTDECGYLHTWFEID